MAKFSDVEEVWFHNYLVTFLWEVSFILLKVQYYSKEDCLDSRSTKLITQTFDNMIVIILNLNHTDVNIYDKLYIKGYVNITSD